MNNSNQQNMFERRYIWKGWLLVVRLCVVCSVYMTNCIRKHNERRTGDWRSNHKLVGGGDHMCLERDLKDRSCVQGETTHLCVIWTMNTYRSLWMCVGCRSHTVCVCECVCDLLLLSGHSNPPPLSGLIHLFKVILLSFFKCVCMLLP